MKHIRRFNDINELYAAVNAGEYIEPWVSQLNIAQQYNNIPYNLTTPKTSETIVTNDVLSVDLGLPSGNLWALCNIGATKPNEAGSKFAWGEIESKTTFTQNNYKWPYTYEYQTTSMTKPVMCPTKYFPADELMTLEAEDDAAHVILGGNWCIPSPSDFNELATYTTWSRPSTPISADIFISKINGKKLIFPKGIDLWTNAITSKPVNDAIYYTVTTGEGTYRECEENFRYIGYGIRPVCKKNLK